MIEVSKNSLIYKLNDLIWSGLWDEDKMNTCTYFLLSVLSLLLLCYTLWSLPLLFCLFIEVLWGIDFGVWTVVYFLLDVSLSHFLFLVPFSVLFGIGEITICLFFFLRYLQKVLISPIFCKPINFKE